jgi:hypothetical protein
LDKSDAAAAAAVGAGDSSESDESEDDDDAGGGGDGDGGDYNAAYFQELAYHQKWARRERRHPTSSSSRQTPIDPLDPLAFALSLILIDFRHIQGLEPVPRDLVHLVFSYAEPREVSYELRWRKEDWQEEAGGPTQYFESLGAALAVMAKNMPDIQEQPEDTPAGGQAQVDPQLGMQQQGWNRRGAIGGYKRWERVYGGGGPLNTGGEIPEWDMMLDEQACRDEFVSDSHFKPPLIDTERRDKIKAKGQVPIPVTRIRLYQRLRARLLAGRFPTEPHSQLEHAVATLGKANGHLFDLSYGQIILYCKQTSTVEYGKWSSKDEKEPYFREGGDYE